MRSLAAFIYLMLVGAVAGLVDAKEVELHGHKFTLAEGFEIEVVAGPPLVERPITADFDERGRLYVAESSGSNDNVQKQLKDRPHSILRLTDTNGDGRFDERTVFADKMMLPEGTLWHEGSLYVSAPPVIWKLTDTDDDGVADKREEWFDGKTLTGCANDLHGPYLGPDGWIYWCKGAFAEQRYERPGQPPLVTKASHIFRARPDLSRLEHVMTGGMDNPVDIAFTPGGDRIFTTTFLQNPAGGKRDGLIHAIYGGVYGKVHEVIDNHPQSGGLLEPLVHLGAAAPCGLTSYRSQAFGAEYEHNLFAACFNLHKITRHVLKPAGATYEATTEDFLAAESLDFHPTDVLEDADGSLIVVDTGGWYRLCCPTSQLAKPDVLGAIYRVRKTGTKRGDDPRGARIDWAKLPPSTMAKWLADPRPAVRDRAAAELAQRGHLSLPVLRGLVSNGETPRVRQQAIWTLCRINNDDARASARVALGDIDPSVVQVALHAVSLWRDREANAQLLKLLAAKDSSPHIKRGAAEALGRSGDQSAVPALLAAAGEVDNDRALEHALIFALIELDDADAVAQGFASTDSRVRRAALIALHEMPSGKLDPALVTPLLSSNDPVLKETANWLIGRTRQWGDALADHFRHELARAKDLSDSERSALAQQLARFARSESIAKILAQERSDPTERGVVFTAMSASGIPEAPQAWQKALTAAIVNNDPQAIATARSLRLGKQPSAALLDALRKVALDREAPLPLRAQAAAVALAGSKLDDALFSDLLGQLTAEADPAARAAAVDVFLTADLTAAQYQAIAASFARVAPLEANRLLAAFERSTDEAAGLALLKSLRDAPLLASLRPDALRRAVEKYPESVRQGSAALIDQIDAGAAEQQKQLEAALAALGPGDVRRGQTVFHSKKASCVACHAVGYLGGNLGPDLTNIGKVRSTRDLLESLLFPSASLVRSYEPVVIATRGGQIHSGTIRRDAADEIILAIAADKQVRIPRDEIEEIAPGKVSIMPAGLDKQLSAQELADLIEYLKAAK